MTKGQIPKIFFKWGLVFLFLFAADQTAKQFAVHLFLNNQFAFSLPLPTALMYLIYAVILVCIFVYCVKHFSKFSNLQIFAWLLILSGAVSNIGERIVLGYVRDFIYISFYKWTGIYNVADGYIIAGIILLLMKNVNIKVKNDSVK